MASPDRELSPLRRGLAALAGGLLALVALPVLVLLPEFGIPLLLAALRLLAFQFAWAARANAWIDERWRRFRRWFAGAPAPLRIAIVIGLLAIAVAVAWFTLDHV